MQDALPTLLPHHAHYVSCSQCVLYVSILFVNFPDAEIDLLFFPFQVQVQVYQLVGKAVLINKRVLLFSH